MVSQLREFKDFLLKTNAIALAVGVIIGGATGKVVTAVVDDVIMPPIATVLPPGDWREAQVVLSKATDATGKVTVNAIKYGHLAGAFVDFTLISLAVFLITKLALQEKVEAPVTEPTKLCTECLESINEKAKRCKFCTAMFA
ncbi:MAG: large conductance mechanosensitive channel protein MscL [Candidatus Obscuribacterales bacterium]|nr:large conductance mechanosensitive channel protein MscL [Candidatus Obscuribacterales bacterium]